MCASILNFLLLSSKSRYFWFPGCHTKIYFSIIFLEKITLSLGMIPILWREVLHKHTQWTPKLRITNLWIIHRVFPCAVWTRSKKRRGGCLSQYLLSIVSKYYSPKRFNISFLTELRYRLKHGSWLGQISSQ